MFVLMNESAANENGVEWMDATQTTLWWTRILAPYNTMDDNVGQLHTSPGRGIHERRHGVTGVHHGARWPATV